MDIWQVPWNLGYEMIFLVNYNRTGVLCIAIP